MQENDVTEACIVWIAVNNSFTINDEEVKRIGAHLPH